MPPRAAKGFNFVSAKPPLRRAESRFAKPRCSLQRERIVTFCVVQKVPQKHARTCKKLPVASFCASETAETGRIANGREQGDHVSRRRAAKGFNFVSAKPPLRRAESRFAKPRSSLQGNGLVLFAACKKYRKNTPRVATLWTPGDDSNLRSIRDFCENDRRSSSNRLCRELQAFRVSTVRI